MWVNALESMIQNEGDKLAKQEIPEYAKVAMSEVETKCIF